MYNAIITFCFSNLVIVIVTALAVGTLIYYYFNSTSNKSYSYESSVLSLKGDEYNLEAALEKMAPIPTNKLKQKEEEGKEGVVLFWAGTFCPVHAGHLDLLLSLLQYYSSPSNTKYELLGIYVSPCWGGYAKRKLHHLAACTKHRVEMLELAFGHLPYVMIDPDESKQPILAPISHRLKNLVKRLSMVQSKFPYFQTNSEGDPLYKIGLVGGVDTLNPLFFRSPIAHCVVVLNRNGYAHRVRDLEKAEKQENSDFILIRSSNISSCSSTAIRNGLANATDVSHYFKGCEKVYTYLKKHRYYMEPARIKTVEISRSLDNAADDVCKAMGVTLKSMEPISYSTRSAIFAMEFIKERDYHKNANNKADMDGKQEIQQNNGAEKVATADGGDVEGVVDVVDVAEKVEKVVVKIGNDLLPFWKADVNFLNSFLPLSPISAPATHFLAKLKPTAAKKSSYVLVQEDLRPNYYFAHYKSVIAHEAIVPLIKELAAFHAHWWNNASVFGYSWLPTVDDERLVSWAHSRVGKIVDPVARNANFHTPVYAVLMDNFATICSQLSTVTTLVHGDLFVGNVALRKPEAPDTLPATLVIDWQTLCIGAGAIDLAALVLSYRFDFAIEKQLVLMYYDLLLRSGVSGYRLNEFLSHYQYAKMWNLVQMFPLHFLVLPNGRQLEEVGQYILSQCRAISNSEQYKSLISSNNKNKTD